MTTDVIVPGEVHIQKQCSQSSGKVQLGKCALGILKSVI